MRWIRFETHGHAAYGIVDGDTVTEVRGDPFAGYEKTATRHKLSSVKLWCRSSRAPSIAPGSTTPST